MHLLVILLGMQANDGWQHQRPEALLAAESGRRFRSASIEWETEYLSSGRMGNGFAKYAGDDYLLHHHRAEADSNVGLIRVQFFEMWQNNRAWHNQGHILSARVGNLAKFLSVNPSCFGMTPRSFSEVQDVDEALWESPSSLPSTRPRQYKVENEGDLILVRARDFDRRGVNETRWWIDPKKGSSVVRCQLVLDDKVLREVHTQLRQYGTTWFPSAVLVYDGAYEDGMQARQVISITQAEFKMSTPPKFGPKDVNVTVGTNITVLRDGRRVDNEMLSWDDKRMKTIPWREMARRVKSGDLHYSAEYVARLQEALANAMARRTAAKRPAVGDLPLMEFPRQPGLWEEYVEQFIKLFSLNAEQEQKAWSIYADCVSRARRIVVRNKTTIQKAQQIREEARAAANTAERQAGYAKAAAVQNEAYVAVAAIYEGELKVRLFKLPTRKQREAWKELLKKMSDVPRVP